jgi:glycosyltransferase involved in cell wall biosynthesis
MAAPAPMRLMFVLPAFIVGGAERQTADLARGLESFGYECCIVSLRPRLESTMPFEKLRFCDAIGYLDWAAISRLGEEIARYAPHVVIAVDLYALMYVHLARWRCRLGTVRIAITLHSTKLLSMKERLQNLAYRRFVAVSDLMIYVCRFQAEYWAQRGMRAARSTIIYNGIDFDYYRPADASQRAAVRARLGVLDSELLIGITAALRPEKNHAFLLRALRELRARGLPVKLLVVGDGPLRAPLERQSAELGVAPHTIFAGTHADVRPLVSAFDLMTLASTSEAFSIAALEAMGMGIPAVLSDVGGARELVLPGQNGYIFAVNDMAEFLTAIQRLGDAGLRKTLGAAARTHVQQNFTRDAMLAAYADHLRSLATAAH